MKSLLIILTIVFNAQTGEVSSTQTATLMDSGDCQNRVTILDGVENTIQASNHLPATTKTRAWCL